MKYHLCAYIPSSYPATFWMLLVSSLANSLASSLALRHHMICMINSADFPKPVFPRCFDLCGWYCHSPPRFRKLEVTFDSSNSLPYISIWFHCQHHPLPPFGLPNSSLSAIGLTLTVVSSPQMLGCPPLSGLPPSWLLLPGAVCFSSFPFLLLVSAEIQFFPGTFSWFLDQTVSPC